MNALLDIMEKIVMNVIVATTTAAAAADVILLMEHVHAQ
jgi:hypothetical protein